MPDTSQNLLLLLQRSLMKSSASALPAAPKAPNPAPQPLKTPSFTTKPPTVGRAVADVRPGTASTVTPKTQSLGTAKATGARQVSVSKPIMAPKEFTAIPTAPLAKAAQSIAFGGGPVPQVDTRNWTKADWQRYAGMAVGAPFVAASLPAVATAGTVGGAASALGGAAISGLGGYNAGTSAFNAADSARHGDYGAAARHGAEAVLSAGFGLAGKVPKALTAAKGAAGVLAGTDLARAGVYAYGGMPAAAGGAAAGALGDLSMFLPGSGLLSNTLRGVGLYGVSPIAGIYEQNAANKALDARTEKLYGPVVEQAQDVATKALRGHGVKVGPYADAIAETAQDAAAGAYAVDSDAVAKKLNPFRKFLTGLTGSDDVVDLVARERMAENGITPGGRQAVADVNDLARKVAPQARAIQDYQESWRGRLDRALGWAGRHKGLVTAGAGAGLLSLLVWRALANRRKKRQAEKLVL